MHLVLRTVGERTTDLALDLAIQHIRPHRVHVVDDVRPFWRAVDLMLGIDHGGASHVVFLDADCLVLEDLRPFLDANELAFVECYVHDPFRGRVPCGVHIIRTDVVERMRRTELRRDDVAWMLRPESTRLELALRGVQDSVQYRGAHILHDHFQHYDHVFAKIALRELRSRTDASRPVFATAIAQWGQGPDYDVARAAVHHARAHVAEGAPGPDVQRYIEGLPETALREVAARKLPDRPALTRSEVLRTGQRVRELAGSRADRAKVFGLGLPRTGTRSLRAALHLLGYDVAHYPVDRASLDALTRGDGRLPLLEHYDGLADVAAVPCFRELDALHRGAKFILTVRDKASWLASMEANWPEDAAPGSPCGRDHTAHSAARATRRFVREAVYGCRAFDARHLSRVYDEHVATVRAHFDGRPGDLLVLDVVGGEGWERLAPFLSASAPARPFPAERG
ncbi:sulfotransferase family protein [Streptomyces noursei]|uniref:sulfotransferase family protein n=1 Tax=Streptomyces noursei TaxID=1971 RepID=UPI0023B8330C|nr:sulfotransferase family protein [Streptomyces noursei]